VWKLDRLVCQEFEAVGACIAAAKQPLSSTPLGRILASFTAAIAVKSAHIDRIIVLARRTP